MVAASVTLPPLSAAPVSATVPEPPSVAPPDPPPSVAAVVVAILLLVIYGKVCAGQSGGS